MYGLRTPCASEWDDIYKKILPTLRVICISPAISYITLETAIRHEIFLTSAHVLKVFCVVVYLGTITRFQTNFGV